VLQRALWYVTCLSPYLTYLITGQVVPFELVKIKYGSFLTEEVFLRVCRLQDKNSKFAGPMAVVRHILKADGMLGLYAGMESTFWRYVLYLHHG
jgi:solute carrier family 25 2-oxodicarboxylate transporter 21